MRFHSLLCPPQIVCVALAVFALSGCPDDERKPIPIITITVQDDGGYRLAGKRYDRDLLFSEITRLAIEHRNGTSDARAIVEVRTQPGASFSRAQDVISHCVSAGFSDTRSATGN